MIEWALDFLLAQITPSTIGDPKILTLRLLEMQTFTVVCALSGLREMTILK
ncbi:7239_t:CDS:1, partial [Ambispora gerdemannii]